MSFSNLPIHPPLLKINLRLFRKFKLRPLLPLLSLKFKFHPLFNSLHWIKLLYLAELTIGVAYVFPAS